MNQENTENQNYESSSYLIKRLLGTYIGPYKNRLLMAILCMMLVAATTGAVAWILQPVIDDIFVNKDRSKLIIIAVGVFAIFVVRGLATYGQDYLMQCFGQRIITDMQTELYKHLLYSDLALLSGESSGKTISRFTNDISRLRASTIIITTGLSKELLTLIALVGVMFFQSFTLAVIAFTAFPVAIYPIIRLGKKMRKISNKTQDQLGDFTVRLDETFKGARVIKAYRQEKFEITRATASIEKIYHLFTRAARNQAATSPLMETVGGAAIAAVILYGGSQVINDAMTSGQFVSFITAVMAAYKPAKTLSGMNSNLQEGLAAARRVFALLDVKPKITDKENAVALPGNAHNISFDNVKFSYDAKKSALNGVSFDVPNGKTIALVGPSGGGKSTIMNLVLRFYDPDDGVIKVEGVDIKDVTLASLRGSIAFVSQDITLFDDTVAANIAYGRPEASMEEIRKAAIDAAADEFISELPDGYNAMIGQGGMTLSGGQRQRISIARAMLKNAPILLLDEATSALDPISEKKIQKALERLMQGRTTIVIAHRLTTVENSDLIYVIKGGKVVESGVHKELIGQGGEYSRLYKGLEAP
jgi:subfamily B ATP-binding cassette protein MsbA